MSRGDENASARASAAAGGGACPIWYVGGGDSIDGGSAFNPHNGYTSYGGDRHGIAPRDWHVADTSRSRVSYGGDASDRGWYVDRHLDSLQGNGSSSFPLPRNLTRMYEPQHALADCCNTGVCGSAADVFHGNGYGRGGETFPSLQRTGARMHVPPHYGPNSRRSGSPLQRYMGHMDDLIAKNLKALTLGDGGSSRRFSDFLNQGQALLNTGDHDAPFPDPYVGMRLEDMRGRMIGIAENLPGCQLLARMVDDGGVAAARQVFDEVAGEVIRFMGHSVGHVLVEKLARHWTDEETITRVLGFLRAASPPQIIAAAKNHAGSKILQTLIGRITGHPEQVESFTRTLAGIGEPGMLSLIEDMSGSLLILKCLDMFSADQNQFITDVILNFSHRVCIDRHGCRVFNRCIDKAGDGETRASLIYAVCRDAQLLAEHGAGNYVVQHVIEKDYLHQAWAKEYLHQAFRGRYVSLSRHKAGSHVVQRCLEFFSPQQADEIVCELLNCERHCAFQFHELISDPYANYVLQTAMKRTKGQMHKTLIYTISSYRDILGVDRFAKQVFQKLHIPRRPWYQ